MPRPDRSASDTIVCGGASRIIQVRTATVIERDGVEISRSFHRHVVTPDADISGESTEVQAICNAVHTDAIKTAYAAHLKAQEVGEEQGISM